jgi:hypothetical protein
MFVAHAASSRAGRPGSSFAWTVEGPNSYWLLRTKESIDTRLVGWLKTQFGISGDAGKRVPPVRAIRSISPADPTSI